MRHTDIRRATQHSAQQPARLRRVASTAGRCEHCARVVETLDPAPETAIEHAQRNNFVPLGPHHLGRQNLGSPGRGSDASQRGPWRTPVINYRRYTYSHIGEVSTRGSEHHMHRWRKRLSWCLPLQCDVHLPPTPLGSEHQFLNVGAAGGHGIRGVGCAWCETEDTSTTPPERAQA